MTERDKFVLSCPGCGRKFKAVEEHFRGRKGLCPACRSIFIMDDPPKLIEPNPGSGMPPTRHPPPPKLVNTEQDATQIAPSAQQEAASTQTLDHSGTDTARQTPLHKTAASCPDATRLAAGSLPVTDNDATQMADPFIPEKEPEATRLAGQAADTAQTDESRVPLVWQPGDRLLDIYRVDAILGQGAFGTVYRVHHLGWEADLAVKTPNPEALDAHGAEIFTGEAETWSELGLHPHIVSCYYVRDLGGVPRVFAEYVDGGSLQESIEQGKVEALEQKLDVAIQFAWGLAYAHSRNMVHKDVKPANVMLTVDGRVKVTDFGLTRAKGGPGGGEEVDIGGGRTVMVDGAGCTPAYASPEQLAGKPVSRAADAWSWAVSILAMFTGGARWRVGVAAPTILEEILHPADGDTPIMPEALAGLLRDCFVLEPEQRLREMNEAADRLIDVYQEVAGKEYPRSAPRLDQALSADSLVNRALSKIDLGRRDQAATLLEEALALQPHHPEATYNLGLLRWRAGEITDMDLVSELEEVRSTHTRTWVDELCLGLVHMERGDFAAAVAVLDSIDEDERNNNTQVIEALEKSRDLAAHDAFQCIMLPDPMKSGDPLPWLLERHERPSLGQFAFSQDLDRIIIHYMSQIFAQVHEVASGKCIQTFYGHVDAISSVWLSNDGNLAVTGSDDLTARLWDVQTGECLQNFKGHTNKIRYARTINNGREVLTVSDDKTIRRWDMPSGQCLQISESVFGFRSVELTNDEKILYTANELGEIEIWNLYLDTHETIRSPDDHYNQIVRITPDGRYFLGARDNTLRFYKTGGLRSYHQFTANTDISYMDINKTGNFGIITLTTRSSSDPSIMIWDIRRHRCLRSYCNYDMRGANLSSSPCLSWFGLGKKMGDSYYWNKPDHLITQKLVTIRAPYCICRISESEVLYEAMQKYELEIKRAEQACKTNNYTEAFGHVMLARKQPGFSREGKAVEICQSLAMRMPRMKLAGGWQTWNMQTGRIIAQLAVSPDGSLIISGAGGRIPEVNNRSESALKVWDAKTGVCLLEFQDCYGRVFDFKIMPDGKTLASIYSPYNHISGYIVYWDIGTGKPINHPKYDKYKMHPFNNIHLSPDGRFVASNVLDRKEGGFSTIKIWSMITGKALYRFHDRSKNEFLRISNDGEKILSYGLYEFTKGSRLSSTLTVRNLATGEMIEIQESGLTTENVFWSPGGASLIYIDKQDMGIIDLNKKEKIRHAKIVSFINPLAVITADGKYALVSDQGNITAYDMQNMAHEKSFKGHMKRTCAMRISPQGDFLVAADQTGGLFRWTLDWELEPKDPCDWNDSAEPRLRDFLALHQPRSGDLPAGRSPSEQELNAYFHRAGRPVWTEDDFNRLVYDLQCAGLGYIRPEGIRSKLEEMASKM